jgi:hypothetical protein
VLLWASDTFSKTAVCVFPFQVDNWGVGLGSGVFCRGMVQSATAIACVLCFSGRCVLRWGCFFE